MKDVPVFIQQLREVADWYVAHPETPLTHEDALNVSLYAVHSREEAAALLRLFAPCEKEWNDDFLKIIKRFPSGATITAVFNRSQVCTRKVVGTRIIPRHVIEERNQDIVEWECDPILKDEAKPEPAQ